jgi:periplasmic protein TonB
MNQQCLIVLALAFAAVPSVSFCQDNPSATEAGQVYKVGGSVTPPHALYSPSPEYPKSERDKHHQGKVALRIVVGVDGLPRDIAVTRSLSDVFDQAAIDTVKRWKFSPATKDGEPVAVYINVELSFR